VQAFPEKIADGSSHGKRLQVASTKAALREVAGETAKRIQAPGERSVKQPFNRRPKYTIESSGQSSTAFQSRI
jgi:hypothetical protein